MGSSKKKYSRVVKDQGPLSVRMEPWMFAHELLDFAKGIVENYGPHARVIPDSSGNIAVYVRRADPPVAMINFATTDLDEFNEDGED